MQLSGLTSLARWIMSKLNGGSEESGDCCTIDQAMSYAPVWHCVSKITGAFKIMPLNVLRYGSDRREKTIQDAHPGYKLLRWMPNSYQPPGVFKSQMMVHALMIGNARAYIARRTDSPEGSPLELIPLSPDRSITGILEGRKIHVTKVQRGDPIEKYYPVETGKDSRQVIFDNHEILHIPGLGYDGVCGFSLLDLARRSWSIGIGAEKQARKFQRKGYTGGIMLEVPENSPQFRSENDAKEFLEAFRKQHEGSDPEKSTIGMLRGGIKANAINMSNSDAQFLEQRRFQREDAALQFCLEGILGDSSNASFNSLEQRNLAYRQSCLAPWTVSWEEECELKLLTQSERNRGFYFKFNDGALLRTEKGTTATIASQLITSRVINPNEAREWFDLNPYDGGDEYANPAIDKKDNGPGGASNQPNDASDMKAVNAMLSNLIGIEMKRVKQAAKSDNFLDKVEEFYRGWEVKLADSIEKIGGDRDLATKHCEQSRERLLSAAECLPEQLMDSVAKCVEQWPNRVQALCEEIAKHG